MWRSPCFCPLPTVLKLQFWWEASLVFAGHTRLNLETKNKDLRCILFVKAHRRPGHQSLESWVNATWLPGDFYHLDVLGDPFSFMLCVAFCTSFSSKTGSYPEPVSLPTALGSEHSKCCVAGNTVNGDAVIKHPHSKLTSTYHTVLDFTLQVVNGRPLIGCLVKSTTELGPCGQVW